MAKKPSAFLSEHFLEYDRNRKRIGLLIGVLIICVIVFLEGGKMVWLAKLFGYNKTLEQKLKSNYTYFKSLGFTIEREWQQEENLALLFLEKTGGGG